MLMQFSSLMRRTLPFGRDEKGVAAIEFVAVAPIFIMLIFATSELADGFAARKKVNVATNSVGDLFSQMQQVTNADATGIFRIADDALKPRPGNTGKFKVDVYFVRFDEDGDQSTAWQCTKGTSCKTSGAGSPKSAIPADLIEENSALVVVETSYEYKTLMEGKFLDPNIVFEEEAYYRPRISNNVKCCS